MRSVIRRSLEATSGKIVIAIVNGELTVKRFVQDNTSCQLVAVNPDYPPVEISEDTDFSVCGWSRLPWQVCICCVGGKSRQHKHDQKADIKGGGERNLTRFPFWRIVVFAALVLIGNAPFWFIAVYKGYGRAVSC